MQRPLVMPPQSALVQHKVEHTLGEFGLLMSVFTQTSDSQSFGAVQLPPIGVLPLPAVFGAHTFTMSPLVASRS